MQGLVELITSAFANAGSSPSDLARMRLPATSPGAPRPVATAEDATAADHLGLGLFLVQSHVTAMGGTVRVESTLGEGTTFRVVLPGLRTGKTGDVCPHGGDGVAADNVDGDAPGRSHARAAEARTGTC